MLLSKATYSAFRLYIYCQYVCSLGIEPTTFTLLMHCSTTEPQEHYSPWEICSFILVSVYIPPQAHMSSALQKLADLIIDTE